MAPPRSLSARPRPPACHPSFPGLADGQGSSGAASRCAGRERARHHVIHRPHHHPPSRRRHPPHRRGYSPRGTLRLRGRGARKPQRALRLHPHRRRDPRHAQCRLPADGGGPGAHPRRREARPHQAHAPLPACRCPADHGATRRADLPRDRAAQLARRHERVSRDVGSVPPRLPQRHDRRRPRGRGGARSAQG